MPAADELHLGPPAAEAASKPPRRSKTPCPTRRSSITTRTTRPGCADEVARQDDVDFTHCVTGNPGRASASRRARRPPPPTPPAPPSPPPSDPPLPKEGGARSGEVRVHRGAPTPTTSWRLNAHYEAGEEQHRRRPGPAVGAGRPQGRLLYERSAHVPLNDDVYAPSRLSGRAGGGAGPGRERVYVELERPSARRVGTGGRGGGGRESSIKTCAYRYDFLWARHRVSGPPSTGSR